MENNTRVYVEVQAGEEIFDMSEWSTKELIQQLEVFKMQILPHNIGKYAEFIYGVNTPISREIAMEHIQEKINLFTEELDYRNKNNIIY